MQISIHLVILSCGTQEYGEGWRSWLELTWAYQGLRNILWVDCVLNFSGKCVDIGNAATFQHLSTGVISIPASIDLILKNLWKFFSIKCIDPCLIHLPTACFKSKGENTHYSSIRTPVFCWKFFCLVILGTSGLWASIAVISTDAKLQWKSTYSSIYIQFYNDSEFEFRYLEQYSCPSFIEERFQFLF